VRYLIRAFAARHAGHNAEVLARVHNGHLEMVRALADGDVDRAMRAVSKHIQISQQEGLEECRQVLRGLSEKHCNLSGSYS
jgi:DNA-binding GntR family transcriptional regulator